MMSHLSDNTKSSLFHTLLSKSFICAYYSTIFHMTFSVASMYMMFISPIVGMILLNFGNVNDATYFHTFTIANE